MKFNEFNINPDIVKMLDEMGFEEASSIQQSALPPALAGRDVIGQAQTGTGKTAAFGIPMLNDLDMDAQGIQGLVIAPTRELAIQVQEELYRYGKYIKARVFTVYGGSPVNKQIERLKRYKPQIVVGTPGRMLDLIRRNVLKLDNVKTLVLDEADEMLNMGFIEDIQAIISETPSSRQTLLFSATMPREIRNLADQFLKNPEHVKVEAQQMTADLIDQYFTKCADNEKFDILSRFLEIHNPDQAIVFCRTKKRVDEVGRGLALRGYNAEMIHGDITQQKRTQVINEIKKGSLEILVATDVAARGLDITGITHVYNYDIPQDPESYVHRIGRTGRAGREGKSITFVTHNEMPYLKTIESLTKIDMTPLRPPTPQEAEYGQVQKIIDRINEDLEEQNIHTHRNTAKNLLAHYDANDLVSALLTQIITDNTEIDVVISPQRPLPYQGGKGKGKRGGGGGGRGRRGDRRGGRQGDRRGGNQGDQRNDRRGGRKGGRQDNRRNDNRGGRGSQDNRRDDRQDRQGNGGQRQERGSQRNDRNRQDNRNRNEGQDRRQDGRNRNDRRQDNRNRDDRRDQGGYKGGNKNKDFKVSGGKGRRNQNSNKPRSASRDARKGKFGGKKGQFKIK